MVLAPPAHRARRRPGTTSSPPTCAATAAPTDPPRGYDLWTLAGDVAGLVRALGARRATIVGAGWGGAVAWTVAALHPRRRLPPRRRRDPAPAGPAPRCAPPPLAPRRRPARRRVLPAPPPARARAAPRRRRPGRRAARGGLRPGLARGARVRRRRGPPRGGDPPPRTSHCALEYFRWAVRSQGRPDGTGSPGRSTAGDGAGPDAARRRRPWVPEDVARASARWAADHEFLDGARCRSLPAPGGAAPRHRGAPPSPVSTGSSRQDEVPAPEAPTPRSSPSTPGSSRPARR